MRCTTAVRNDGNHVEFESIEKLDEIVRDLTQPTPWKAGGMSKARSVNHDHPSMSRQWVGTSGDA